MFDHFYFREEFRAFAERGKYQILGICTMLLILPRVALLLLHFGIKDAVCRTAAENLEVIKARLGEELILNCTFNCSTGFIRGVWKWEDTPACGTCLSPKTEINMSEDLCIVSLKILNLTLEQTLYNYSCVSVKNDDQALPQQIERLVSLHVQEKTAAPAIPHETSPDSTMKVVIYQNQNKLNLDRLLNSQSSYSIQVPVGDKLKLECLSTNRLCEGQWMSNDANVTEIITGMQVEWIEIKEEDEGTYTCHTSQLCTSQKISVLVNVIKHDELGWIRPFAATALLVAGMMLFLLIYLCYKKREKNVLDAEVSPTVIYENTRTKNEGMIQKPIVEDCQSDHEVPYADIVISVRGSSIPELAGLQGQTPRDHRLRWREEASRTSLEACRSADRLHVHPREVSRKLSTTSEYAVITYSTDALH